MFLAFNYQAYQQAGLHELLSAFLFGLRFDVAAICRINSVFIILSMLPFTFVEKSSFQKFLKILFLLTNIPFLIVNVVDYEYYKFTGQRASLSVLDMGADVTDQIAQLSFHYWYLAIIAVLLSCALYYFVPVRAQIPMLKSSGSFRVRVALSLCSWYRRWRSSAVAAVGRDGALPRLWPKSAITRVWPLCLKFDLYID